MQKNNVKGKTTEDCLENVIKIIFFMCVAVAVFVTAFFLSNKHGDPFEAKKPVFMDDWEITDPEGDVFKAGRYYHTDGVKKGDFTMTSVLPDNLSDDLRLCFAVGGNTQVYIDGQLRGDFDDSRDIPLPGGCVKRFYMTIPLQKADSGCEVSIIRLGTKRRGYIYQDTMIATEYGFISYIYEKFGLPFFMAEILFIFSLVIVIISMILGFVYKKMIELFYGSMGILVISLWIITNSYLCPFVYGHYHIDGILNYILCMMIPYNLVFYIDAIQHGRYRKVMNIVLIMATVNLFVCSALHFTRTFSFGDSLVYMNAFLGLQTVIVMVVMILEIVHGNIAQYKYTAIGFMLFLFSGLSEIVILNFFPAVTQEIPMIIGLTIFQSFIVIQQIDDLKKIRDERQKAIDISNAKTRFLASMSHEIRTPINSILGMNEMILRENSDKVNEEYADNIKSAGNMLLMLVNDVLDFSKIEAGKMDIAAEQYRLSVLLKDIIPMLKERADEKGLLLKTEFTAKVPDGQIGDEFRIRQVLINLINNAVKYTDKGSVTLRIGGERSDEGSYLMSMAVKDTGRGISEEGQKHLFEAFTRADISKNSNIEGTGLGLAIVKSIIDSMGGSINVESKPEQGSEFAVRIPVGVFDDEAVGDDFMNSAKAENVVIQSSNYTAPDARVLAVDDNLMNLKIVTYFLKRVGIVPDTCENGTQALKMCAEQKYDLILLDHMMPEPDGIKTLKMLREDKQSLNCDTVAIVLTANALAESRKIYIDAGFADYLTKPLDASLLEQTVKKYLPNDKIIPFGSNV